MMYRSSVLLFVLPCLLLFCQALPASPSYIVHDLTSALPQSATVRDMSGSGLLAGDFTASDGKQHAFRWSRTGGSVDLGVYGGGSGSGAKGVSAAGWVAGYSYAADGGSEYSHAMLWKPDGTPVGLDLLPGAESSTALSVNDLGQTVGTTSFVAGSSNGEPVYENHVVIWNSGGSALDLGVLFPDTHYTIGTLTINNAGTVLGRSSDGFCWLRSASGDYTYLDGSGYDISGSGTVVGGVLRADGYLRAAVWSPDGALLRTLAPLGGSPYAHSRGYGINDGGFVVGQTIWPGSREYCATLWTPNGTAVNLGSLLPSYMAYYSGASQISDDGWVLGGCDGLTVMWEPVPEPSSAAALIAGLFALAPLRRRWG